MQVVAFRLGGEEFAIDIMQLREVIKTTAITSLPHSISYIEGVINLRGDVIPVVNLRKRFCLAEGDGDESSCIMIADINSTLVGLIVDQVSEVIHFDAQEIKPPPRGLKDGNTGFILGIGNVNDRLIVIIRPEMILDAETKVNLQELSLATSCS